MFYRRTSAYSSVTSLFHSQSTNCRRCIFKCLFLPLDPNPRVVSGRGAPRRVMAAVACAIDCFWFSKSADILKKPFYLARFHPRPPCDDCDFIRKDFDRGLFFPSAQGFCARLYETLICFSLQRKHSTMVSTFKGEITAQRSCTGAYGKSPVRSKCSC